MAVSMTAEIDIREFARSIGTVFEYDRGDVVFHEGDEPRDMYVVLSGAVDIIARDLVIETIYEGNALGVVSLLDGERRTATARARKRTSLVVIDRKKFRNMIEEMPNFCLYVMGELAHRLRATNAALES